MDTENGQALTREAIPPLVPVPATVFGEQSMPVSTGQERMWYLSQVQEPAYTYNEQLEARIEGSIDMTFLKRSLNTIIDRQQALRTVFTQTDNGELRQIILEPFSVDVPLIGVGKDGMSKKALEKVISHTALEQGKITYDLAHGPLFRVCVLQLPQNKQILLFSFHHIILDGKALTILLTEINDLYTAELQGLPPSLAELPIQWSDYAHWEQQWIQTEAVAERLNYWKQKLKDLPPILTLPVDHSAPVQGKFHGAWEDINLSKKLTEKLLSASWEERVAPYIFILAAYKVLLMRYAGQSDIAVGTLIANRPNPNTKDLLGFFTETTILRSNLSVKKTFRQLLHELSLLSEEAVHKQAVPFSKLVEAMRLEDTLAPDAYPIQAMLAFDSVPFREKRLAGQKINHLSMRPMGVSKFDLTLSLKIVDDRLSGYLEYNTDLFDVATIKRFVQHFQSLLESVLENREQDLSRIPFLTKKESQQILIDWNNTEIPRPEKKCIHELFQEQVEQTPNALALIYEDQQLTYEELNKKSNHLAHFLIKQGVQPESKVGLCLERSLEMVIGILGILKAGGAYIPIDSDYPQQRIEHLLSDSGVVLLLTESTLLTTVLKNQSIPYICLNNDWATISKYSNINPETFVTPANLAYVLYTSGSTGKPKGVMVNHASLQNHAAWKQRIFQFDSSDVILHKTPIGFDVSVWEWSVPLITGAQLVIAKPRGHREPDYLLDLIAEKQVTVIQVVPSLLELLLKNTTGKQIQSLRYLFCGGEALSASLCKKFNSLESKAVLYNLYGPTEATIDSTYWAYQPEQILNSVPIGRPIDNTQVYILGEYLNPVPKGVLGELYVSGELLARGYLNRADLTAERFIPNPFNSIPASRLYKTGDLARYLTDGNIEYIGRTDHQVKVRGFRIELGEIENTLIEQEGIREAIVLAHSCGESEGNHYLAAYVVCDQELSIDQSLLRDNLKSSLPDYMVPSFFVELEKLPLTPNGKVDRKALPVPDADALYTQEYVAPRTESEKGLVDIWANILNLPTNKIGIQDNFFDLGGHSLLATRVVSQIRKTFHIEIQIRELFTLTSIEALAEKIDQQQHQRQLTKSLVNKAEISNMADTEEMRI